MVNQMASSALAGGESQSGQTKDCKICICCFSAKYTALRSKSKDWLTRKQDNMFERVWHVYLQSVVLSELALKKNPTKRVGLVQNGPHHHHLIEN